MQEKYKFLKENLKTLGLTWTIGPSYLSKRGFLNILRSSLEGNLFFSMQVELSDAGIMCLLYTESFKGSLMMKVFNKFTKSVYNHCIPLVYICALLHREVLDVLHFMELNDLISFSPPCPMAQCPSLVHGLEGINLNKMKCVH